jgi:hypothetical protein
MKTTSTRIHRSELRDFIVPLRDLATSLIGDPAQGDAIMRVALRELASEDRKRRIRGEEAKEWLTERVIALCLEATDCPNCAEECRNRECDDDLDDSCPEPNDPDEPDPSDAQPDPDDVWSACADPTPERRAA